MIWGGGIAWRSEGKSGLSATGSWLTQSQTTGSGSRQLPGRSMPSSPRAGIKLSKRGTSSTRRVFKLGREDSCMRRHSLIGTNTAAGIPRRVTICGPCSECDFQELAEAGFRVLNLPITHFFIPRPSHHMPSQTTSQDRRVPVALPAPLKFSVHPPISSLRASLEGRQRSCWQVLGGVAFPAQKYVHRRRTLHLSRSRTSKEFLRCAMAL